MVKLSLIDYLEKVELSLVKTTLIDDDLDCVLDEEEYERFLTLSEEDRSGYIIYPTIPLDFEVDSDEEYDNEDMNDIVVEFFRDKVSTLLESLDTETISKLFTKKEVEYWGGWDTDSGYLYFQNEDEKNDTDELIDILSQNISLYLTQEMWEYSRELESLERLNKRRNRG